MQNYPTDLPPNYTDAMNTAPMMPNTYAYPPPAPGFGGISQQVHATPSTPAPYTEMQKHIITQPMPSAPPIIPPQQTYGTIGQTTVTVPSQIIIVNGCSACRIGVLDDNYTCCGICLAICCFPIGILCCLAMKNKRCSNCGHEF